MHTSAPLQSQHFSKKSVQKISNFREILAKTIANFANLQHLNFAKFLKLQLLSVDNLVDFKNMLKNMYLVANIGADTAVNEQIFAKILPEKLATTLSEGTRGGTHRDEKRLSSNGYGAHTQSLASVPETLRRSRSLSVL